MKVKWPKCLPYPISWLRAIALFITFIFVFSLVLTFFPASPTSDSAFKVLQLLGSMLFASGFMGVYHYLLSLRLPFRENWYKPRPESFQEAITALRIIWAMFLALLGIMVIYFFFSGLVSGFLSATGVTINITGVTPNVVDTLSYYGGLAVCLFCVVFFLVLYQRDTEKKLKNKPKAKQPTPRKKTK